MFTKHKAVPGALLAILTTALAACPLAAFGQQTLQMTNVLANVDKGLDAKKAKAGDAFTAKTVSATTLNDGTNVPAGSILEGHVDSVTPSDHKSDSMIVLTIDKVQVKGGKEVPVKATIVSVTTFETALGQDTGGPKDKAFDTSARDTARMNGVGDAQAASTGPRPVPGLSVTSTAANMNSGTLTQSKGNVHLSNQNQIQVGLAVIPPGVKVQ
jgi:hypothetical protein